MLKDIPRIIQPRDWTESTPDVMVLSQKKESWLKMVYKGMNEQLKKILAVGRELVFDDSKFDKSARCQGDNEYERVEARSRVGWLIWIENRKIGILEGGKVVKKVNRDLTMDGSEKELESEESRTMENIPAMKDEIEK
jgi:hypothetical protein